MNHSFHGPGIFLTACLETANECVARTGLGTAGTFSHKPAQLKTWLGWGHLARVPGQLLPFLSARPRHGNDLAQGHPMGRANPTNRLFDLR
jgi:hypothetical protein